MGRKPNDPYMTPPRIWYHLPHRTPILTWLQTLEAIDPDRPARDWTPFEDLYQYWRQYEGEKSIISRHGLAQALTHTLISKRGDIGRVFAVRNPFQPVTKDGGTDD